MTTKQLIDSLSPQIQALSARHGLPPEKVRKAYIAYWGAIKTAMRNEEEKINVIHIGSFKKKG